MSIKLKLLSTCLLLSFLTACHEPDITADDLAGTFWVLTSMPGELPAGVEINLQFELDQLGGKGVCNRYFSGYTISKGNKISIAGIGSTKILCTEHSQVESSYFQILGKAESIMKTDDQLTIKTADGDLVYMAAEPPADS